MSLHINRIRVDVIADRNNYGFDIPLHSGLNIVRADNTCGKTTCSLSLLYALGLEGMLQATHDVPMADVVTSRLLDGDVEVSVIQSFVMIEIANERGELATIKRVIKGQGIDHRLVHVWDGHTLTNPGSGLKPRDMFVRMPRSAQSEAGFHTWLKRFIGWEMPKVPLNDGTDGPLYLEIIAPLHYVEQKKGWGGIQAGTPSFGIREPTRRALEFVLDLSGPKNAWKRERIRAEIASLKDGWKSLLNRTDETAMLVNGRVGNIPEAPIASWPPNPAPIIEIMEASERLSLAASLTAVQGQVAAIQEQVIPSIREVSQEIEDRLRELSSKIVDLGGVRNAMSEQIGLNSSYLQSVVSRLESLNEELQRNKDAKRLQEMGSQLYGLPATTNCHTCGQPLPPSLLPVAAGVPVMTLDENIAYIDSQRETLSDFSQKLERVIAQQKASLRLVDNELAANNTKVRDLKESLVQDGRMPSKEAVRTQVLLEDKAKRYQDAEIAFNAKMKGFQRLSDEFRRLQTELQNTPTQVVPPDDQRKLSGLHHALVEQLRDYGFTSFNLDQLSISTETYRPIRDSVEVGYNVSASDMIRLIWSYLLGLMEVSHSAKARHAGLLILDEPRQQSAKEMSFKALLSRSSKSKERGQQVIIFTSEPSEALRDMISGLDVYLHEISGRLIQKLPSPATPAK